MITHLFYQKVDMKMKTKKDLKKAIPNFNEFKEFISKFKDIVDNGKLAEFYCRKLFGLKPVKPRNSNIDAISQDGKKIEIKHRSYSGKIPPGMEINLENIDYVFYVKLNDNLLPEKIFKVNSKDIDYKKGKRVSFKRVFEEKRYELIFQS